MSTEIERKFLVKSNSWRLHGDGTLYRQGYLATEPDKTVRVRVVGNQGYLWLELDDHRERAEMWARHHHAIAGLKETWIILIGANHGGQRRKPTEPR